MTKSLLQLGDHECRWPVRGTGLRTRFCAEPVVEGRSYCEQHMEKAYVKTKAGDVPPFVAAPRMARPYVEPVGTGMSADKRVPVDMIMAQQQNRFEPLRGLRSGNGVAFVHREAAVPIVDA